MRPKKLQSIPINDLSLGDLQYYSIIDCSLLIGGSWSKELDKPISIKEKRGSKPQTMRSGKKARKTLRDYRRSHWRIRDQVTNPLCNLSHQLVFQFSLSWNGEMVLKLLHLAFWFWMKQRKSPSADKWAEDPPREAVSSKGTPHQVPSSGKFSYSKQHEWLKGVCETKHEKQRLQPALQRRQTTELRPTEGQFQPHQGHAGRFGCQNFKAWADFQRGIDIWIGFKSQNRVEWGLPHQNCRQFPCHESHHPQCKR